jgi:hypothetical protein
MKPSARDISLSHLSVHPPLGGAISDHTLSRILADLTLSLTNANTCLVICGAIKGDCLGTRAYVQVGPATVALACAVQAHEALASFLRRLS